ncbi:MAG: phenylacetate--CoA ligase family protein, partial [Sphingobacteriaceae bacterium]|nr:phenylacetate--CoA ligase family protein [Cytophagaceae bacterium]
MYSPQTAFLPPEAICSIQEQGLRELLRYLIENSPFYGELFSENGIDLSKSTTLADLTQLPTTTKEDLHQRGDDFLCVDRERIIEYTSTSGTLGSLVTIALTENDLDR